MDNIIDNQQVRRIDDSFKNGWLIGIIDGEGWITLNKNPTSHGRSKIQYVPIIGITNSDEKILQTVVNILREKNIPFFLNTKRRSGIGMKEKIDIIITGFKRVKIFIDIFPPELFIRNGKYLKIIQDFIKYRESLNNPKEPYTEKESQFYLTIKSIRNPREHTLDIR